MHPVTVRVVVLKAMEEPATSLVKIAQWVTGLPAQEEALLKIPPHLHIRVLESGETGRAICYLEEVLLLLLLLPQQAEVVVEPLVPMVAEVVVELVVVTLVATAVMQVQAGAAAPVQLQEVLVVTVLTAIQISTFSLLNPPTQVCLEAKAEVAAAEVASVTVPVQALVVLAEQELLESLHSSRVWVMVLEVMEPMVTLEVMAWWEVHTVELVVQEVKAVTAEEQQDCV